MLNNSFDIFLSQLGIAPSMYIDYHAFTTKPAGGKWFRQCIAACCASTLNEHAVTTQLAVLRAFHMTHNLSGDKVIEYDLIAKLKLSSAVGSEHALELYPQIEKMSQRIVAKSGLRLISP